MLFTRSFSKDLFSVQCLKLYQSCFKSIDDEPAMSFYGVYDGHAGKDAAAFAASHLHGRIIASSHFPNNPVEAIKEAFNRTDESFLEKVRKLQHGFFVSGFLSIADS